MGGSPWIAWYAATVDGGSVDSGTSVALDSGRHPHIVYENGDPNGARYARRGDLFWDLSMISLEAHHPTIAIDTNDRPHVALQSNSFLPPPKDANLMYGHHDGSQWVFETIDVTGDVGGRNRIKVDTFNRPHIVYADRTNADVKYAFKDGSGWRVETIDTDATPSWIGFDLDPTGNPHVAYSAPGGTWGRLKYAVRTSGVWERQTIDAEAGTFASMAVDLLGKPHVAYRGAGEVLKYATYNGVSWDFVVVDALDSPTGWDTSIDTDSENVPHIAYLQVINRQFPDDPRRGHLKYASVGPNGQWFTEYADPQGIISWPSIAVDAQDRPRIAYYFCCDQPHVSGVSRGSDIRYAEPVSAATLGKLGV